MVGGAAIVAPIGLQSAWAKPSVTRNAPKSKLTSLNIKMVSASPIVSLLKTSCTYDPQTHQAAAGGAVAWSPPTGGGALGTISVAWTASPTKVIEAHSHEKGSTTTSPQSYSISATTSQLFSGLWSLTASPTEVPKSCTVTGDFAPPTAETVEAYLAAKGLPIFGVVAYAAATDPNHLLGRPTGYLSKVAWQDSRIDQSDQSSDPGGVERGGGIEVYPTAAGASSRATYLNSIETADPILGAEYDFLLGPILLRVSGTFTPDTAASYGNALPGATLYTPAATSTTTTAP